MNGGVYDFITATNNSEWQEYVLTKDMIEKINESDTKVISWHLQDCDGTIIYIDDISVSDSRPFYTVNYYIPDANGDYNTLLKTEKRRVNELGDTSDVDFSDIRKTVNGFTYVYSAIDKDQVAITENGQVITVNCELIKIVDSFETLVTGAADTNRFGKLEGGNIYYEAGAKWSTAEITSAAAKDGSKSVKYYIYNSASVTLKITMADEQLTNLGASDTINVSFRWYRVGGSDTAVMTPYIGTSSGSQIAFTTPEHKEWGTLTIRGKDKIQEFIAAGGVIALKVDLTGGFHYVYVYVDEFEIVKGEPVEGGNTSVTHNFERESTNNDTYVEHAAFSGTGYLKNGGENTAYSGAYLTNIEIATDNAHSGSKSLKVTNDGAAAGWGKLQIDLTPEQKAALKVGSVITFWYKAETASTATTVKMRFNIEVNGVAQGTFSCFSSNYGETYTNAIQWKQISIVVTEEMLTSYGDKIVIITTGDSSYSSYTDGDTKALKTYNLWIDDITITSME